MAGNLRRKYSKIIITFVSLFLISIPIAFILRFISFNAIARQKSLWYTLKSIVINQNTYFHEFKSFTKDCNKLIIGCDCSNLYYTIYMGTSACYGKYIPPEEIRWQSFVERDKYIIIAVGNIDSDKKYDVWSVDEKGELKHLINDIFLGIIP